MAGLLENQIIVVTNYVLHVNSLALCMGLGCAWDVAGTQRRRY